MANKRGARKAPELSPEAIAANAAGEARREKEKAARLANAAKQRRFREGMKAEGYKQVLLWDMPCPAGVRERITAAGFRQVPAWERPAPMGGPAPDSGTVRLAVCVHESTLEPTPEIKAALSRTLGGFLRDVEKLPRDSWKNVYADLQEIIRVIGVTK
jgi:hypothetical protein